MERLRMIEKIRYIAAYRSAPISAITHYAEVDTIAPYGESGKYKLTFKSKAKDIGPIHFGDAKSGSMQGSRYANLEKMKTATKLTDFL